MRNESKSRHDELTSIRHNLGKSPEYFGHFLMTFLLKLSKSIGILGRFQSPLAISILEFSVFNLKLVSNFYFFHEMIAL